MDHVNGTVFVNGTTVTVPADMTDIYFGGAPITLSQLYDEWMANEGAGVATYLSPTDIQFISGGWMFTSSIPEFNAQDAGAMTDISLINKGILTEIHEDVFPDHRLITVDGIDVAITAETVFVIDGTVIDSDPDSFLNDIQANMDEGLLNLVSVDVVDLGGGVWGA